MVNYRHGDICIVGIEQLPTGLKASDSKVLHKGKTQQHSFNQGKFYPKEQGVMIGYLEAKNTTLLHPEHGKKVKGKTLREAKIKDGIYEVRVQQEHTHDEMKRVVD